MTFVELWDWIHENAEAISAIVAVLSLIGGFIAYVIYQRRDSHPSNNGSRPNAHDDQPHTTYQSDPEFVKFVEELKGRHATLQQEKHNTDDPEKLAELNEQIAEVSQWRLNPLVAYQEHLKLQGDMKELTDRLKGYEGDDGGFIRPEPPLKTTTMITPKTCLTRLLKMSAISAPLHFWPSRIMVRD